MSDQYVPNLDPVLLQSVTEELQRKEALQRRHYFLLEQVQAMHAGLPVMHRNRVSHDQLCRLANALLDGTVFQIVGELREMQHLEEKSLAERRGQLEADLKRERADLATRQAQEAGDVADGGFGGRRRPHEERRVRQAHELQSLELERAQADRLKKFDMKIIMELDQRVLTQQSTLEKSGVPGFFVTNSPNDIRTQMILMDFIMRLSQKQVPA